jgi:hypothetical protein
VLRPGDGRQVGAEVHEEDLEAPDGLLREERSEAPRRARPEGADDDDDGELG